MDLKELKSFLFGLSFCLWQRIAFIDYVQRSSSCLYRRLRYRNCLNYITLHYMDRTQAEETKRQHCKKSSPVEPSRTKEERQTKEHLERRSWARDEGSRRHMGFTISSSTGSCEVETVHWWPMLHIRSDKGFSQVSQGNGACLFLHPCSPHGTPACKTLPQNPLLKYQAGKQPTQV